MSRYYVIDPDGTLVGEFNYGDADLIKKVFIDEHGRVIDESMVDLLRTMRKPRYYVPESGYFDLSYKNCLRLNRRTLLEALDGRDGDLAYRLFQLLPYFDTQNACFMTPGGSEMTLSDFADTWSLTESRAKYKWCMLKNAGVLFKYKNESRSCLSINNKFYDDQTSFAVSGGIGSGDRVDKGGGNFKKVDTDFIYVNIDKLKTVIGGVTKNEFAVVKTAMSLVHKWNNRICYSNNKPIAAKDFLSMAAKDSSSSVQIVSRAFESLVGKKLLYASRSNTLGAAIIKDEVYLDPMLMSLAMKVNCDTAKIFGYLE